jgi:hypothetical protein
VACDELEAFAGIERHTGRPGWQSQTA